MTKRLLFRFRLAAFQLAQVQTLNHENVINEAKQLLLMALAVDVFNNLFILVLPTVTFAFIFVIDQCNYIDKFSDFCWPPNHLTITNFAKSIHHFFFTVLTTI